MIKQPLRSRTSARPNKQAFDADRSPARTRTLKKEKGPARSRPFPICCLLYLYPFVTTGGGGVAQPAIVARASTAIIARASFFIDVLPRAKDALTIRAGAPVL